ncbi:MAG: hypothetical protein KAR39_02700 [Thermoplasmata archaeon]|nr:hypothetical protein [Thermoplasmata archaeon]
MEDTEGNSTPKYPEPVQQTVNQQQAPMPMPKPKPKWPIAVIAIVIVAIVVAAILLTPGISPVPGVKDSDGDGYPDNVDEFPDDPDEWEDSDGDGYGDNGDEFPDDPDEWRDKDGDGHGDNGDEFPNDSEEWRDKDGDGHGDNGDEFPNDPNEWKDSDQDGVGDNQDEFPYDPTEWEDSDGDGCGDNGDMYPHDPSECVDSDLDGIGDNADFWDSGNGGLKIVVDYFLGDCGNWFGDCEPEFLIEVDIDMDGSYDIQKTQSYGDNDELFTAIIFTFDINDDHPTIKFHIKVTDLDGGETIDYNPDPSYTGFTQTRSKPYNTESWSHQGLGSPSCLLQYSMTTIGV